MMEIGIEKSDDESASEIPKKEQQNDDRERAADQCAGAHILNGVRDELRLVVSEFELQVGVDLLDRGDLVEDVLGGLDGVRLALLGDDDADRLLAVQPGKDARLLV